MSNSHPLDPSDAIPDWGLDDFIVESDPPFCWECLHVEEEINDPVEDFEWENVSDRTDLENPNPNPNPNTEENVEWEVLLLSVSRTEGFEEFEVLFDQFGGQAGPEWMKMGRPAAKSVVENLPSVLLTAEDVADNNTNCAVCKDEISLKEEVKRLPCLHYYHECCILPWLVMRNTCPLCRHELPCEF